MRKRLLFALLPLFLWTQIAYAQSAVVTLGVDAGYEGYFRDSEWLPVIIHAANDGDSVSGRLVVRPETSGSGITNTFSTPVTLPAGARQTVFLYITARSFGAQLRVELIDDTGAVIAQQEAGISAIQPQDRLSVVITNSPVGAVDLTGVHAGNYNGYQADLVISNLPEKALDSIDLILLTDVDSGAMSSAQLEALTDWVISGGHLIVTGGQNWQATATGVVDLLPLTPDASREIDDLQPLASWLHVDADLSAQTVIATGTLSADAQVLAAADDGTPLIARRTLGAGEVDYLAADPNNAPLRGWNALPDLWFTLITSENPAPGWGNGFIDWESAARATEILPGYDPLPDILPLCGFLALYIGLIGPLNYVVLNRINRREWAWLSIPLLILLFSVLSYVLGFNLRGNEVTLNRLAVVQSWHDSDRARVDQLVGLLSPRRSQYSMTTGENDTLRPIPRPLQAAGILARNTQSSVNVRESDHFEAQDFNVDASFIAGFHLTGMIDKPEISGEASIAEDPAVAGQQVVRGSVRNDSAFTLTNPVILARGVSLHLEKPLAPGDIATFDLTLPGTNPPAPALRTPVSTSSFFSFRTSGNTAKQSVIDIVGADNYANNLNRMPIGDSAELQAQRRQQYFLTSFIDDYFGTSGRGDRVYLAGWTDAIPLPSEITGANWNSQDTTIYIFELDSQRVLPVGSVTVSADQFTWAITEYNGLSDVSPATITMQPGEDVAFRYTPLPDAVLKHVSTITINANDLGSGGVALPVQLWNWQTQTWENVSLLDEIAIIDTPARFLGPQNAVQVRLAADETGGYMRISRLNVTQTGTF